MQLTSKLKKAIQNNAFSAIATHLENGEIQNHLMWIDYRDNFLLINTEKGRKKTFNIRGNSYISLLIFHRATHLCQFLIGFFQVNIL